MESNKATSIREVFEQMSTEQLEPILDEELHAESPDSDTIRLVLEILRERKPEKPVVITPETEEAWKKYQRNSAKIWKASSGSGRVRRWVVRAGTTAAILTVVLLAIVPQRAEADSFWGRLARWTTEIVEFFGPNDNMDRFEEYEFKTNNSGLQRVYDAVVALGVTEPVVPMWLPDGAELIELTIEELDSKTRVHSRFFIENSEMILYLDIYNQDIAHKFEKDNTEFKKYEVHSTTFIIMRNNELWVAISQKNNVEYSITIDCQEDILYRILDSLYEQEDF